MRLYQFDGIDDELKLLPMAARRALDVTGLKLSLNSWQGMDSKRRRALVELGSQSEIDVSEVRRLLKDVRPPPEPMAAVSEPSSMNTPQAVSAAFGSERPIPDATWSALSPLDRYTLVKVASRRNAERLQGAYEEIVGMSANSTHLSPGGGVRMVGVDQKPVGRRSAVAQSRVEMSDEAFARLAAGDAPKGDVLSTARLAGIMAAKKTSELIPLCHPLALTRVEVEFTQQPPDSSGIAEARAGVAISARVQAMDRTGVEMEALTAASVAALTVYDMLKAFDRGMCIGPTRLLEKSGGRSGDYRA